MGSFAPNCTQYNTRLLPLWTDEKAFARGIKTQGLKIHQRFHFASALKRMSVLASYEKLGSTELCYISTVKGAPETLRGMVHMDTIINMCMMQPNHVYVPVFWCSCDCSFQNVRRVMMKSTRKCLGKVQECWPWVTKRWDTLVTSRLFFDVSQNCQRLSE